MKPRTVMIVDDDEDILLIAALSASRIGNWRVVTAGTGMEALDLAQRERPDLILLDAMMPVLDGYETCRRLKRESETKTIPVVLLTAKGRDVDKRLGYEVGAVDYIVKPFSPNRLIERIQEILGCRK